MTSHSVEFTSQKNQDSADGGEDARIHWKDGVERTNFLPGRFVQFQLKSGSIAPKKAGKEVQKSDGTIKEMVRNAMEQSGNYILVNTSSLNQQQIRNREDRIFETLKNRGLNMTRDRVHFWSAEIIVNWINVYPSITVWLCEQTESIDMTPFRSWQYWSLRFEHESSPWVEDDRLDAFRAKLLKKVTQEKGIVRVVGLPDVGKSRLTLEAFKRTKNSSIDIAPLVMYVNVNLSEVEEVSIFSTIENMARAKLRAMIIVDQCSPGFFERLSRIVSKSGSQLSLICIEDVVDMMSDLERQDTIVVDKAPRLVIEKLVHNRLPNLKYEDRYRLVNICLGFPGVVAKVTDAWSENRPLSRALETFVIDAYLQTSREPYQSSLQHTAELLAAFGPVRYERKSNHNHDLEEIARFLDNLTPQDLRRNTSILIQRGIAKKCGDLVAIQPRPLALALAEKQWHYWDSSDWHNVLTGSCNPHLKVNAARQLALLNTTEIARKVVREVCQADGPLDGFEKLSLPGHAEVIERLAYIDVSEVAALMLRIFKSIDVREVRGEFHDHLISTIRHITFARDTFYEGADMLLELALEDCGSELYSHACSIFASLFPLLGGETEADGDTRLKFLREKVKSSDDPRVHRVLVEGLASGIRTSNFSYMVGANVTGSHSALQPWQPIYTDEATLYLIGCMKLLTKFCGNTNQLGRFARRVLGFELPGLLNLVPIEAVENVVEDVHRGVGQWMEAITHLGRYLKFKEYPEDSDHKERVSRMIEKLRPSDLGSRISYFVSDESYDYPEGSDIGFEEKEKIQIELIDKLACETTTQLPILEEVLPKLVKGNQKWASKFAYEIAIGIDSYDVWVERIVKEIGATPKVDRNFDFLAGFLRGIGQNDRGTVEEYKREFVMSPNLSPAFPRVCKELGISTKDISLAIEAVQKGTLEAQYLSSWGTSEALREIDSTEFANLVDVLLAHSKVAFYVGVDILVFAHARNGNLHLFQSQVIDAAKLALKWSISNNHHHFIHNFAKLVTPILKRGRSDATARKLALALARLLVRGADNGGCVVTVPVVRLLLSTFPEIVWPLVGNAIVDHKQEMRYLQRVIGRPLSLNDSEELAPLLELPEETLFAWCEAWPEKAPAFVARTIPIFGAIDGEDNLRQFHPMFIRLLHEFGDCDGVLDAASSNMSTLMWEGSLIPYLEQVVQQLETLRGHPKIEVDRWSRTMIRDVNKWIEQERDLDDAQRIVWEYL